VIRPALTDSPAQWLLAADVDWWDLVRYGPPAFEVYVRVSFGAPVEEGGELPTLRQALAILAKHTATSRTGYAAVWEGCLSTESALIAPRVRIPNRTMLLFSGPIDELRDAPKAARIKPDVALQGDYQEPHLVWPEDQAWCVACEVDEEIEFSVGCSLVAYQALEQGLPQMVRQVNYGQDAPLYRS